MTKQTYIGNGRNKNFYFTFPFFSPDEVLVKINDIVAVEYGLFCVQGVSNQDFPFTGGHVKFTKPPKPTDIITIERNLQYNRVIDYQETAKINPTTLNQDMNYFFESLKDIKSILNEFNEKYAEFTDTESANDLKERITAVTEEIENLGDISTINTNISELGTSVTNLTNSLNSLTSTITTHTTNIGTNTNDITTLKGYDYVIESQEPTAENNYTWYRKYKSGWVEMGGIDTVSNNTCVVNLPCTMADTNYFVFLSADVVPVNNSVPGRKCTAKTTSSITVLATYASGGSTNYDNGKVVWTVFGVTAI